MQAASLVPDGRERDSESGVRLRDAGCELRRLLGGNRRVEQQDVRLPVREGEAELAFLLDGHDLVSGVRAHHAHTVRHARIRAQEHDGEPQPTGRRGGRADQTMRRAKTTYRSRAECGGWQAVRTSCWNPTLRRTFTSVGSTISSR